jgi:predicted transcriptional regulator
MAQLSRFGNNLSKATKNNAAFHARLFSTFFVSCIMYFFGAIWASNTLLKETTLTASSKKIKKERIAFDVLVMLNSCYEQPPNTHLQFAANLSLKYGGEILVRLKIYIHCLVNMVKSIVLIVEKHADLLKKKKSMKAEIQKQIRQT